MSQINIFELNDVNVKDLGELLCIKDQLLADSKNIGINKSVTANDPTFTISGPNTLCVADLSFSVFKRLYLKEQY